MFINIQRSISTLSRIMELIVLINMLIHKAVYINSCIISKMQLKIYHNLFMMETTFILFLLLVLTSIFVAMFVLLMLFILLPILILVLFMFSLFVLRLTSGFSRYSRSSLFGLQNYKMHMIEYLKKTGCQLF